MGIKVQDKHRSLETDRFGRTIDKRSFGAHSVRFSQICANCNNGWMNDLERATQPIFELLLTSLKGEITFRDSLTLSHWMFKTMSLLQITQQNDRKLLVPREDLRYFYANKFPPGHGYVRLYRCQPRVIEKVSVYLARMRYFVPISMPEEELTKLKQCFVSYLQVGGILFRYVYLNPANRWQMTETDRIPSGQNLWPLFSEQVEWEVNTGYLPQLSKDDYVVPLALVSW